MDICQLKEPKYKELAPKEGQGKLIVFYFALLDKYKDKECKTLETIEEKIYDFPPFHSRYQEYLVKQIKNQKSQE